MEKKKKKNMWSQSFCNNPKVKKSYFVKGTRVMQKKHSIVYCNRLLNFTDYVNIQIGNSSTCWSTTALL